MSTAGLAPRAAALDLLHAVLYDGRMLGEELLPRELLPAERARALSLAGATLRSLIRIDAILDAWLAKAPPLRVRNALRLCAAELLTEGTAPHAAVDAAVRLVEASPKTRHLKPLTNAVARRLSREGAAVWAGQDAVALSLPPDLMALLVAAWGEAGAAGIAAAHLTGPAPLDLTPRDPAGAAALAVTLGAALLPTGSLRLGDPGQISALPGYASGDWWVQDAAAALPARMLGDVAGRPVLDLCAAPGGKTMQLAAAGARVTALDSSAQRLARLAENLTRTGLAASLVTADLMEWSPPGPVEAILLDAPCSSTGTLRRHPDLALLKAELDLRDLTRTQDRMLARAWDWLAPGGRLVFCTCSILPEEGEARLARFLARHPEARVEPPSLPGQEDGWLTDTGALRLRPDFWPDRGGMDGFFAVLLRKA